jgi:CheY-like chemotaxis protein
MHLMQDWHPDLVLLDVWIPGTAGQELCRQLKQQEPLKQIPLLLMSAHHDLQKVSEQAGADGYLRKPFTKNVLLSTIALALQQQTERDL